MSTTKYTTNILRSGIARRATTVRPAGVIPAYTRRAASGGPEPPRSQSKPAQAGETKAIVPIAAAGLALGACFFYLMSKPQNAPKVAHATGNNLKELSARDTVNKETGQRMGTHRAD